MAESAIVAALTDVEWPARLEYLPHRGHTVVIDGAHNPAGARALASYLRETYGRRLPMVVGIMRDKNVDALIEALAPAASQFVMTAASSPRAATPGELRASAERVAPDVAVPSRARRPRTRSRPRSRSAIRSSSPDRSISPAKCAPNLWYTR